MTVIENKEWSAYIGVKALPDVRKIAFKVSNGDLNSLSVSAANEDITRAPVNVKSVTFANNGGNINVVFIENV